MPFGYFGKKLENDLGLAPIIKVDRVFESPAPRAPDGLPPFPQDAVIALVTQDHVERKAGLVF